MNWSSGLTNKVRSYANIELVIGAYRGFILFTYHTDYRKFKNEVEIDLNRKTTSILSDLVKTANEQNL